MKKVKTYFGIAPWKIDHPMERFLERAADRSRLGRTLYVNFYKYFDRAYYDKGLRFIERNIKLFAGDVSDKQKREYTQDMVYSLHRFGCMFDEYFLFDFPNLNTQGRDSFLTDKNRWAYYHRMNTEENKAIFDDKARAYARFRPYYRREVLELRTEADAEAFFDFMQRHRRFIVKPIAGSGGKNVFILSADDFADPAEAFAHIRSSLPVVVEELIETVPELKALHPASLNTVRVPTLKLKDRIEIYRPFLRIGVGGSVVDNAANGGVFVPVDARTGVCTSEGVDEFGRKYIHHPDSGITLPGYQIPRWEEAVSLVKELACVLEDNHYVGWDLALTKDGWIMVEGNPGGQFVIQIALQKGVKKEIEAYISQM